METEFAKDLDAACEKQAPVGPIFVDMNEEIAVLQEYFGLKYNNHPIPDFLDAQIKRIGYSAGLGFDKWYEGRIKFYKSEWEEMSKHEGEIIKDRNIHGMGLNKNMGNEESQNISEINCVNRFLSGKNFTKIEKNPIQNEIDVFAFNDFGEKLQFQIVRADPKYFGDLGIYSSSKRKHRSDDNNLFIRDNDNSQHLLEPLKKKGDHYKKQGKNMLEIILLLDDTGDIPDFLISNIKNGNANLLKDVGFKEVWYVGNSTKYKLYGLGEEEIKIVEGI